VIAREFVVAEGCEPDFALVFAAESIWSELLRPRSDGYLGTELHLVSLEERRYRVFDYWKSHLDFESFRESYQSDVEQFRKWLASKDLVQQETLLGSFYRGDSDFDEGVDLVPS
jgi:heme-degrading monooxygenase HmoA